ncbi:MAG: hypothetical protein Q8859_05905, partial [Bacteroidota bacterium]|nr:hypothetical protein [Bacteroidota bacterium]
PGVYVYHTYPSPFETDHQIFVKGAAELTSKEDQGKVYDLRFGKGKGLFYLIGGPSYQDLNSHVEEVLKQKPENLLNRTIADWHTFSGTRSQFDKLISNQNANKTELLKAVDDVSVLLKTQQGREGGVLAGHYYHLAYVRDEYGVSRALLALGYVEQARKILQFYYDLWRQYGHISNAQAIGVPGIFHRHENDEVEITGYILIQAFDYFGKTKNQKFIKEMMPFLEWCWEAQKKNLVDNMLPFNGDETYIAGGMIPRKVLNDGSSEATLLFIEGGRKFISFIERLKCKDREWILKNKGILDTTVEHYRENFMRDGKLLVNNPRRAVLCNYPETRYGVCLYPGHGGYQGLLNHYKGYMYFCQECSQKPTNQIKLEEPEEFFLPSSYLMPIYIGSTLFSKDEKEGMLKELIKLYQKTGKITINQQDERLLGYDYGLFLYALTEFNHPLAGEIYRKMMDLRDGSGAWVEYYNGKEPSGCRYRPWESGINIEAAIHYVGRH